MSTRNTSLKEALNWKRFNVFADDLLDLPARYRNQHPCIKSWYLESRQGVSFDDWVANNADHAREMLTFFSRYITESPSALAEAEEQTIDTQAFADMVTEMRKLVPMSSAMVKNTLGVLNANGAIDEDKINRLASSYATPEADIYLGDWTSVELEYLTRWMGNHLKRRAKELKPALDAEQDRNTTAIGQPKPVDESMSRERKTVSRATTKEDPEWPRYKDVNGKLVRVK